MNVHHIPHANGAARSAANGRLNGYDFTARAHGDDDSPIRVAPQNIDAEQALLGALMYDNKVHSAISALIEPAHFFDPLHKQIYEAATGLIVAGRLATPVTLKTLFASADPIETGLTVPQYLGKLVADAPSIIGAPDYAREVVDLWRRRQLILIGEELQAEAYKTGAHTVPNSDLIRHASATLALVQANDSDGLKAIDLGELKVADLAPREWVINGLIPECGIAMIYAWRGGGKTWVGLGVGIAAASGTKFLRWEATRARRVLHVCGEMPAIALRERLDLLAGTIDVPAGNYSILSSDLHEHGLPDLATPEGQSALDAVIRRTGADLIILDNLSTLMRTGVENESEGWLPVQNWLLSLRRQGRSTIVIHHANKARGQRGTSRREDVLDVVLNLRQPQDYDPSEGARFEAHFEKARGLHGDAVEPFEARMEIHGKSVVWTMRDIADAQLADIEELRGQGRSIRQIATELGVSKSAVQRALKKSACPADPRPRSGTAGQPSAERDSARDTSGTGAAKDQPNQYKEARNGGT